MGLFPERSLRCYHDGDCAARIAQNVFYFGAKVEATLRWSNLHAHYKQIKLFAVGSEQDGIFGLARSYCAGFDIDAQLLSEGAYFPGDRGGLREPVPPARTKASQRDYGAFLYENAVISALTALAYSIATVAPRREKSAPVVGTKTRRRGIGVPTFRAIMIGVRACVRVHVECPRRACSRLRCVTHQQR